jgi:hypothetical protein
MPNVYTRGANNPLLPPVPVLLLLLIIALPLLTPLLVGALDGRPLDEAASVAAAVLALLLGCCVCRPLCRPTPVMRPLRVTVPRARGANMCGVSSVSKAARSARARTHTRRGALLQPAPPLTPNRTHLLLL